MPQHAGLTLDGLAFVMYSNKNEVYCFPCALRIRLHRPVTLWNLLIAQVEVSYGSAFASENHASSHRVRNKSVDVASGLPCSRHTCIGAACLFDRSIRRRLIFLCGGAGLNA